MKKVIISTLTACALLSSTMGANAQVFNGSVVQTENALKSENALVALPKTTGKYQVGSATFDWTDSSRKDYLDPNNNRELMVQAWYPIDNKSRKGKEMEPYIPMTANAINQIVTDNGYGGLFADVNHVNTDVYKDGVLSSKDDKYPIVLFSHGLGMGNWNYQWLTRELANQGFIVFSIDYPHLSAGTEFNDGRYIPFNPPYRNEFPPNLVEFDNKINNIWVKDLQFVINKLETLNKTDKNFKHKLDLNKIAAVGHSMGGAASARALQVEPKIKSAINMDGTFFGLTDAGGMTKPFAFIATEKTEDWFNGRVEQMPEGLDPEKQQEVRDMNKVTNDRYKQAVSGPAYDITIAGGAEHGSFTDLALLRPYLAGTLYDNDIYLPPNSEHIYELSNRVIVSFLEKTLNGKQNTILDRKNVSIPDLTIVQ